MCVSVVYVTKSEWLCALLMKLSVSLKIHTFSRKLIMPSFLTNVFSSLVLRNERDGGGQESAVHDCYCHLCLLHSSSQMKCTERQKMKNGPQSCCLMDEASLEQTRHVMAPFDGHVMDKCETE